MLLGTQFKNKIGIIVGQLAPRKELPYASGELYILTFGVKHMQKQVNLTKELHGARVLLEELTFPLLVKFHAL